MRRPSSTGPEGSLVVHTTRASAWMARRSSSVIMFRLRVSGSCSAMFIWHAFSQSGCSKIAWRVRMRSSVTIAGSAISHSSRALTRSQRGVLGGLHGERVEALHDLGVGHRAAHRVEHDAVDAVGVVGGVAGGDPAAEGLAGEVGPLGAEGVEDRGDLVDVVPDLQRVVGLGGVAVADEVDGPHGEVLGVRGEVADVGLGVAGDAVQEQQDGLGLVAGVQVAGAVRAGLEEALGELDLVQVVPDAGVRAEDDRMLAWCWRFLRVWWSGVRVGGGRGDGDVDDASAVLRSPLPLRGAAAVSGRSRRATGRLRGGWWRRRCPRPRRCGARRCSRRGGRAGRRPRGCRGPAASSRKGRGRPVRR